MEFLDLPNDILLSIADVLSIEDLPGLLSSCRHMSSLLTPYIYNRLLRDKYSPSPLRWAATHGHTPLVELAISKGAKIDERGGPSGRSPLHFAARCNHPNVIRVLAKQGASIDATDYDNQTPLHLAAESGKVEATRVLLALGADMTRPSKFMRSPAQNAAIWGGVGCLKAFIDAGFDFTPGEGGDLTILHKAVVGGDLGTLEYLLGQEGAKVAINARGSYGETPLHLATGGGERSFDVKLVWPLLDHGADIYAVDDGGNTPAHCAVYADWAEEFECMGALLDAGFDFKTRGSKGRTILHEAVFGDNIRMLEYLLGRAGARVAINAQDYLGRTPLHLAASGGGDCKAEFVSPLLHHGADMYVVNLLGHTPAHSAVLAESFECMEALLDAGFDFKTGGECMGRTILHEAVLYDRVEMLEYLLGKAGAGAAINVRDTLESTPLHWAVGQRLGPEMARMLLGHGADTQLKGIDGETPAHKAARMGDVQCMEAFLDAGFDISTRGGRDQTILHKAVIGGAEMVKYLLGHRGGAIIINDRDSEGLTPLEFAARDGTGLAELEGVMSLLVQYGADPEMKNSRLTLCEGQ